MKAKKENKKVKELSAEEVSTIYGGGYQLRYIDGHYRVIYVEDKNKRKDQIRL